MGTELPAGWKWSRLGKQFKRVTRKNTAGITRVLTASGEHGLIDQEEFFNKRVAARNISGYFHLKHGEFAYNRSSMGGYPFGAIKRLERYSDGVLSTLYLCFALRENAELDASFATHLLDSGILNSELAPIARVGARAHGLLNVTPDDFFEIQCPLPPLPEQKKIAAILGAVDEAIQATQAVIDQTRRVKAGLLQTLLTRGIGHTRFKQTEIGEIPESWQTLKLRACIKRVDAGKSPAAPNEQPQGNEWGVLKVSAIGLGSFSPEQSKRLSADYVVEPGHMVKAGDLIISRANTASLVGAACRVPEGNYRLMLSDKTLRLAGR